jgi:hypothetical protein
MLRIDRTDTIATPLWLLVVTALSIVLRIAAGWWDDTHPQTPSAVVAWQSDAEMGEALEGKPRLFYFTADWSQACKTMEEDSFRNLEIVKLINSKFEPVRVVDRTVEDGHNPKRIKDLETKYSITDFPSTVIALPDGTWVSEKDGVLKHGALKRYLDEQLLDYRYFAGLEAYSRGNFEDAQRLFSEYLKQDLPADQKPIPYAYVRRYLALRCLGRDEEAKASLNLPAALSGKKTWPFPLIAYLKGILGPVQLAQQERPEVHSTLADADGKEELCAEHLKAYLSNKFYRNSADYRVARYILSRLPEKLRQPLEKRYMY